METYIVTVDGTSYEVTVEKKTNTGTPQSTAAPAAQPAAKASSTAAPEEASGVKVTSGTSGKIWKVIAAVGDTVKRGDTIVILEAMKMEIPVVAPEDGQVLALKVAEGDSIETGDLIAVLKP